MTPFRYWIDVDDDNQFAGADEITADVISAQWRIGLRNSHARLADETVATVVVKNTDGKYAPENPASPLYGVLHPQKRLRITYDDLPLWTGWLSMPHVTYRPLGDATGTTTATLTGIGGKQLLEALTARLPLYTDVTADHILTDILTENVLPPAIANVWRLGDSTMSHLGETSIVGSIADFAHLDAGKFRFAVFGDMAYDDLWAVIHHLVIAERGHFFFNRDGRAVFWNRHRLHAPYTPIATITSDGEFAPHGVIYRYGEGLVNEAWVECMPRKIYDEAVLWSLDSPLQLAPNQQLVIEARLRRDGGQYVGAGANIIATPSFAQGTAHISITPLGGKALIHIKNTNRRTIINQLTLQGISSARQNLLGVVAQDEASRVQYGRYGTKIRIPAPADVAEITNIAQYEVLQHAQPKGKIERISYIQSATSPHPQQMLWTLGSALHIHLPELHHQADYIIIGEIHAVEARTHRVDYVLHPVPLRFWALGETDYSELGNITKLAY